LIVIAEELELGRSYYTTKLEGLNITEGSVDSAALSLFQNKLYATNRKYDSIITLIETDYPNYHQLKYDRSTISIENLQKQLTENTTMIEYFDADSSLFAFVMLISK